MTWSYYIMDSIFPKRPLLFTSDVRDVYELLRNKDVIYSIQLMASYLLTEIRWPTNHKEHDRIIIRLNKLTRIMELYAPSIFKREINHLRNMVFVLESFKDDIKRRRLFVLKFIYPHISKAIRNICMKEFLWQNRSRHSSIDYFISVYVWPIGSDAPPEKRFSVSSYYPSYDDWKGTRGLEPEQFEEIVNKVIKRRHPDLAEVLFRSSDVILSSINFEVIEG